MTAKSPTLSEEIRARLHLRRPCWKTLMAKHPELSDSTFWRRVRAERTRVKATKSASRRRLRDPFASVERRRDMTRLLTDLDIKGQLVACFSLADRIRRFAITAGEVSNPYWADQSIGLRVGLTELSIDVERIMKGIEPEIAWERRLMKGVRAASPGFAMALNVGKISLFNEEQVIAFRHGVSILGDVLQDDVSPGATPATLRRALAARRNMLKSLLRLSVQMFDDTYARRFGDLFCEKVTALPEPDRLNISSACAGDIEAFLHWQEESEAERMSLREKAREAQAPR